MQLIPLSGERGRGLFAQVDDDDCERAARYSWNLKTTTSGGQYAVAYVLGSGRRHHRKIYLHTLITGWSYVEHRDGDGLNCQRDNMRKATHRQNMANMKHRRGGTSDYRGVSLFRPTGRWHAQITVDYKNRHLGYFILEEDAARAYDAAAVEAWGEFARLNFPPSGTSALPGPRREENHRAARPE